MKKISVTLLYREDVNYDDVRMLLHGIAGGAVPAQILCGELEELSKDDPVAKDLVAMENLSKAATMIMDAIFGVPADFEHIQGIPSEEQIKQAFKEIN